MIALVSLRMDLLNCVGRHQEVLHFVARLDRDAEKVKTKGPDNERPEKPFTLDDGEPSFLEPDLEFKAGGWIEVVIARKALSASAEELWPLVRKAVSVFPYLDTAQWWLRELRGESNDQSRTYSVLVNGRCQDGSQEAGMGFFRNYTVVAESPEKMLAYIQDFEPGPVTIEEYNLQEEQSTPGSLPDGVYYLSGYSRYAEEESKDVK